MPTPVEDDVHSKQPSNAGHRSRGRIEVSRSEARKHTSCAARTKRRRWSRPPLAAMTVCVSAPPLATACLAVSTGNLQSLFDSFSSSGEDRAHDVKAALKADGGNLCESERDADELRSGGCRHTHARARTHHPTPKDPTP